MQTYMLRPRRNHDGYNITQSGCHVVLESINKPLFQAEQRIRDWNRGKVFNDDVPIILPKVKRKPRRKMPPRESKLADSEAIKAVCARRLIRYGRKVDFMSMRAKDIGCSKSLLNRTSKRLEKELNWGE